MKISNTSEYALRILSFMAKDPGSKYSAKYLVEQLNISDKYLRRLMTLLAKAGFISSTQGRDGGYYFAKKLETIYLYDIINTVEGMDKYLGCVLGFEKCSDENPCVMHTSWVKVRDEFLGLMQNVSLADLNFNNIYKF